MVSVALEKDHESCFSSHSERALRMTHDAVRSSRSQYEISCLSCSGSKLIDIFLYLSSSDLRGWAMITTSSIPLYQMRVSGSKKQWYIGICRHNRLSAASFTETKLFGHEFYLSWNRVSSFDCFTVWKACILFLTSNCLKKGQKCFIIQKIIII